MPAQLREALSDVLRNKPVAGASKEQLMEDEFLSLDDLVPVNHKAAERSLKRLLSEIDELIRETKWEDAVSIFYPVEEKQPELIAHGLDAKLRTVFSGKMGQPLLRGDVLGVPERIPPGGQREGHGTGHGTEGPQPPLSKT